MSEETVTFNLEINTEQALTNLRQLERVALRYLALARKIGLPENVNQAIQILTRIMIIMRMIEMSGTMLFSGTPLGLLMGIAGIAMANISILEGY